MRPEASLSLVHTHCTRNRVFVYPPPYSSSTMSSSTPTPTPDRDQQLLAVGRQCSHPSCLLVDFLPFKCQHCADSFCADHFKPASHTCSKYDESKYNRVAPDCERFPLYPLSQPSLCPGPLCNEPVPIPPGEDPNIRMERHLSIDCSVMTGRSRKASSPKCSRPKCGKVLFAQIQCDVSCPLHKIQLIVLTIYLVV
jgi:AN1-like Zinc finger